jgi:hypothetical protein
MSGENDDTGGFDAYDDDRDDAPRAMTAPERNQIVKRSFEGISTLAQNAATQAMTAKATADINARWMIAMHRPRDIELVRQNLLVECDRPGFASKAIYEVPRGGSKISGMTIRFAEAAMAAMGNMGCEAMTLYDDDDQRVVRVTVTNYESSVTWSRDITIPKTKEVKQLKQGERAISERINSSGQVVYKVDATDDDVATKEAAMISKASRTNILRAVPGWLVAQCRARCETTQKKKATEDPDAYRRKAVDAFASLGIKVTWLVEYLGKPLDQALPEELAEIERLYRAIKEKEISAASAMSARKGEADAKPAGVAASAVRRGGRKPEPTPPSGDPPPVTADEAAEIARRERSGG